MSAQMYLSVLAVALFLTEARAIVCHQCQVQGQGQSGGCSEVCDTGGSGCFAEIVMFEGSVSRRWGCIPAGASLATYCQTYSSSIAAYNVSCCETDYCNQELNPSLSTVPPATTTQASTPTDPTAVPTSTVAQPSEPTTNSETTPSSDSNIVSTEATTQTEPASSSTSTEPPTTPPTTQAPQPMTSQNCYRSKSDSPNDVRLCSLQTTCFVSVRKHADNRLSYRRGCTPQTSQCVPENRNRKIKVCCNTSLCNFEIPNFGGAPELVPNGNNTTRTGNITTPIGTTPPNTSLSTPTHLRPTAPDIGTIGLTSSDDPHAPDIDFTDAPDESTMLPTDRSTPANTVGTIPPETPPPTDVLPDSSTSCVCDSCTGGRCSSTQGCATVYNRVADGETITRICVLTPSICESSNSENFRVVCCKGELCNHANNTETPPTTDDMGRTEATPSSSKETLSIYYILTILMSVIFIAIATTLLIICVCTYQHHRKRTEQLRKKHQLRHRTTDPVTKASECSTRHFNL